MTSPTPWTSNQHHEIRAADGTLIALVIVAPKLDEREVYTRIVECINACHELEFPDELPTALAYIRAVRANNDAHEEVQMFATLILRELHVPFTAGLQGWKSSAPETATCSSCNTAQPEVCQDGYCRPCHVSLTFEDCVSGAWAARQQRAEKRPPTPHGGAA